MKRVGYSFEKKNRLPVPAARRGRTRPMPAVPVIKPLAEITQTTPSTKYKILTYDTSDDNIKIFKSIAWVYGLCIAALKHLRSVITIDAEFLLDNYKGRLLMACRYVTENKLFPLAFGIMNEENVNN
jgi:hypothetical protein